MPIGTWETFYRAKLAEWKYNSEQLLQAMAATWDAWAISQLQWGTPQQPTNTWIVPPIGSWTVNTWTAQSVGSWTANAQYNWPKVHNYENLSPAVQKYMDEVMAKPITWFDNSIVLDPSQMKVKNKNIERPYGWGIDISAFAKPAVMALQNSSELWRWIVNIWNRIASAWKWVFKKIPLYKQVIRVAPNWAAQVVKKFTPNIGARSNLWTWAGMSAAEALLDSITGKTRQTSEWWKRLKNLWYNTAAVVDSALFNAPELIAKAKWRTPFRENTPEEAVSQRENMREAKATKQTFKKVWKDYKDIAMDTVADVRTKLNLIKPWAWTAKNFNKQYVWDKKTNRFISRN